MGMAFGTQAEARHEGFPQLRTLGSCLLRSDHGGGKRLFRRARPVLPGVRSLPISLLQTPSEPL